MSEAPAGISNTEISFVLVLHCGTQILRVPILAYFLVVTTRYLRGTATVDAYTSLTFIFLSTQLFFQLSGGIADYLILTDWTIEY